MGIAAILGLIIGCSCMYYFSKWADAQVTPHARHTHAATTPSLVRTCRRGSQVRARQAGSRPSGPETELNPSEPLGGGGGYIPSKASSNKMISASVVRDAATTKAEDPEAADPMAKRSPPPVVHHL
jgi:hypothetical protein